MADPIEEQWFSVPGFIVTNPETGWPTFEELKTAAERGSVTSFNRNDVFSFDGDEDSACVIVNKLKPVYHLILMPAKTFRKEMFS